MGARRVLGLLLVLTALFVAFAGCGGDEEEAAPEDGARAVEAIAEAIAVDGDASDWDGISGLDVTLEAIEEEDVEPKDATVRVVHDDEYLYVLFEVEDDYNWNPDDAHLSGAAAVMWSLEAAAGAHMGSEDPSGEPSAGTVDIWHWELECASGEETGGEVSAPGEGEDPGNDEGCNFDDEWSTSPEEREDDNGEGAENSLLGVWSHTNPTEDAEGSWIFEMRRPLETGDEQDAQFAPGEPARMALAYWDADGGPAGWEEDGHVQTANQGWIDVNLTTP